MMIIDDRVVCQVEFRRVNGSEQRAGERSSFGERLGAKGIENQVSSTAEPVYEVISLIHTEKAILRGGVAGH